VEFIYNNYVEMAIYADDAARRRVAAARSVPTFANQQRNSCAIKNAVRHVSNLVSLSFVHLLVWWQERNGATTSSGSFCRTAIIYPHAHCPAPSLLTWPREPGA